MPRERAARSAGTGRRARARGPGICRPGDVRIGRAIELEVAAASPDEAESRAREMCDRLLANPVTEDYELEVEQRA